MTSRTLEKHDTASGSPMGALKREALANAGFALVVTLSLMVLLTVIAVGLLLFLQGQINVIITDKT